MSVATDIRAYKSKLRIKYKAVRHELSTEQKALLDEHIISRLMSMDAYKRCETVFTYVSTSIEVNTHELIRLALKAGKKVAVPKCIAGTRFMDFYYITSFDDLEVATFSVLEPKTDRCKKVLSFENSVCIVPGLAFDVQGYRLGYGKGYYDRFLSGYNGINIGLCYCACTQSLLQHGRYDCAVDYLITEKYIKKISGRTKNG